jgi:glycosyltransferase involved in cell wall biosynthesis
VINRILVDCSDVYSKPWINTGIQRVVRNVIKNIASAPRDVEAIAVVVQKDHIFRLKDEEKSRVIFNILLFIERGLVKTIEKCWFIYHQRKAQYLTYPKNAHRVIWLFFRVVSLISSITLRIVKFFRFKFNGLAEPIICQAGDVILLIDASWNDQCFEVFDSARSSGAFVVVVVHDVIPLARPDFFADVLVQDFNQWFKWVVNNTDGIIGVSKHTANQVSHFIPRFLKNSISPWVSHSYNGEGLPVSSDLKNSKSLIKMFAASDGRRYLNVGTLEPRKNHAYILDAFDLAWANGADVKLILIGKEGWRCAELLDRIKQHKQLGNKLIWMRNVSDSELNTIYTKADELIISSFDEGFGLPIVESLARKTPVLASDIEVFREFGDNGIRFFDLENPAELARQLVSDSSVPVSADWTWPSWAESTRMLFDNVIEHSNTNV